MLNALVAALAVVAAVLLAPPRLRAVQRLGPRPRHRVAPRRWSRLPDRRVVRRREEQVPAFVRALAAELRAGSAAADALAAAADQAPALRDPLQPVIRASARGGDVPAELAAVGHARGAERLSSVAAVWSVAERHGAGMADVLDRVAAAYADEDAARRDLAATVAGARVSMFVLALLPLGGLLLGGALGTRPWAFLFGRPLGLLVLLVALALEAVGLIWARRILRPP